MPKVKKIPRRQCVGCREARDKPDLIRVVKSPEGVISLDFKGKKPGRGAYLCRNIECFRRARKSRSLERVLKTAIPVGIFDILEREIEADAAQNAGRNIGRDAKPDTGQKIAEEKPDAANGGENGK